jgi:formate dehydrogenase maturation protein FdhE
MIAEAPPDAAASRAVDGDADVCPQCGTAPKATTLLTSMTRYYACSSCAARWSVARKPSPFSTPQMP